MSFSIDFDSDIPDETTTTLFHLLVTGDLGKIAKIMSDNVGESVEVDFVKDVIDSVEDTWITLIL